MTEAKTHTIDRSKWSSGPWDNEPDRVDFEHAGLPCLLLRNPFGAWCGYAAVPPGHPLHGTDADDAELDVHGGVTYADRCQSPICHVPKPGEPDDVWWFGFDCAHFRDLVPGMPLGLLPPHGIYRDVNYARTETESLAAQLRARE